MSESEREALEPIPEEMWQALSALDERHAVARAAVTAETVDHFAIWNMLEGDAIDLTSIEAVLSSHSSKALLNFMIRTSDQRSVVTCNAMRALVNDKLLLSAQLMIKAGRLEMLSNHIIAILYRRDLNAPPPPPSTPSPVEPALREVAQAIHQLNLLGHDEESPLPAAADENLTLDVLGALSAYALSLLRRDQGSNVGKKPQGQKPPLGHDEESPLPTSRPVRDDTESGEFVDAAYLRPQWSEDSEAPHESTK